ncbi:alpha/beta fold hydrolase [Nocardioides okcheonensis]|uniref:alpha/beta fold hydrolase n=1 Tax=Nocardioides okcheonensis TaxID=2894081 RepID=UPI001E389AF9|nr:alpha/beta fold hydrolase [Nocardioides okcheonensis]UFN44433.1 alpha/beta hydrolase [Nocardioides okcheonensis]
MLVSERIGQFFVESDGGRDRLEYTEYGSGDQWVVLLHGLLMPRRMQQPLARAMAARGLHVVTLDLLGHGRSDQPGDPLVYSMTAFGEQVVALLDHLGAEQAVVGGTSLGANVALEVAVIAPERVRGLVVEMPVLDNALVAGIVAFVPIMFAARYLPFTANALQRAARSVPRGLVPFWVGVALDTVDHRAETTAAMLHGVIFGRVAPSSRQRRRIQAPTLVVGHPVDPIHPFVDADMLAVELPHVRMERATSILEWRFRPERLTAAATDFAAECWSARVAGTARGRKR